MDFDSSLGFPGEGPVPPVPFRVGILLFWAGFGFGSSFAAPLGHGNLDPRNKGDQLRQELRRDKPLPEGRPVEKSTQTLRDTLWRMPLEWGRDQGIPHDFCESCGIPDADDVNAILVRYGRALYNAGRPYNYYTDTVNALSSRHPKLRRLLQPAWDVAFQWQRYEPHIHHQAMPWQVLLAFLTSALLWGWLEVASVLALARGGLARIGEIFAASRSLTRQSTIY